MKAGLQPSEQASFGAGQIHRRHADLGESQLTRFGLNESQQLNPVHVPAIVESPQGGSGVVTRQLHWPDESHTAAFAQRLAECAGIARALIELQGDLGAGKTSLVRHLLRALGVSGRVKSPTYAVVEPYQVAAPDRVGAAGDVSAMGSASAPGGTLDIWHFDFYRFNDPEEWADAGFRDVFASPGLKLVEWADKARPMLPPADLVIALHVQPDDSRQVTLQAYTLLGQGLLP